MTSDEDSSQQGEDVDLNSQASISDNENAMEQWLPEVDQDQGIVLLFTTHNILIPIQTHSCT